MCLRETIFLVTQPFAAITVLPFCPYDLLSWQSPLLDISTKERPTMHLNLERANSSGCSAAPGPFTTCQRLKRRVSALAPVLQPCERCKPAAVNHRCWLMEGGEGSRPGGTARRILERSFVRLNTARKQWRDFWLLGW